MSFSPPPKRDGVPSELDFLNLIEVEEKARPVLSKTALGYIASGRTPEGTACLHRGVLAPTARSPHTKHTPDNSSTNKYVKYMLAH